MSDSFEDLGELLDELKLQVTVTGWKNELISAEKELKLLREYAAESKKVIDLCSEEMFFQANLESVKFQRSEIYKKVHDVRPKDV